MRSRRLPTRPVAARWFVKMWQEGRGHHPPKRHRRHAAPGFCDQTTGPARRSMPNGKAQSGGAHQGPQASNPVKKVSRKLGGGSIAGRSSQTMIFSNGSFRSLAPRSQMTAMGRETVSERMRKMVDRSVLGIRTQGCINGHVSQPLKTIQDVDGGGNLARMAAFVDQAASRPLGASICGAIINV